MFDMLKSSATLFFQGKLFADNAKVYRQMAMGIVVTALVLIALTKVGVPVVAAAIVAGLIGGALQPFLIKNLKYR